MNKKNFLASASLLLIVSGGLFQLLEFRNLAGISMLGIASLGYLLYRDQSLAARRQAATQKKISEIESIAEGIRSTMRWYGTQLLDYGDSTFKRIKSLDENDVPLSSRQKNTDPAQELETYFSPLGVEASHILEKPSAHVAGRLAAEQRNTGNSEEVTSRLVDGKDLLPRRKILLVGSRWMSERLSDVGDVSTVAPGRELEMIDGDTAYFVIDEDAAYTGPWSGVFDAQGTTKFSALYNSVKVAKANGTVIVVISSEIPGHYTGMLQETADVLVEGGFADLPWDSDLNLPVIKRIESLVQERSENV